MRLEHMNVDDRDTVVQAYVGAFEAWRTVNATPWSIEDAVKHWYVQRGPTHLSLEGGRLLRTAMIEVLRG